MSFSRARLRARAVVTAASPIVDKALAERIQRLIGVHSTLGYRRLWPMLRFGRRPYQSQSRVSSAETEGVFVNQRVMRPRPRVHGLKSREQHRDQRWAMDVTQVPCGTDGWGHLTAVVNRHDHEVTGFEFALRGRTKEAERALEDTCLARFAAAGRFDPAGAKR